MYAGTPADSQPNPLQVNLAFMAYVRATLSQISLTQLSGGIQSLYILYYLTRNRDLTYQGESREKKLALAR
jgi:hypothetical protein